MVRPIHYLYDTLMCLTINQSIIIGQADFIGHKESIAKVG